jgi:hypothetical protein
VPVPDKEGAIATDVTVEQVQDAVINPPGAPSIVVATTNDLGVIRFLNPVGSRVTFVSTFQTNRTVKAVILDSMTYRQSSEPQYSWVLLNNQTKVDPFFTNVDFVLISIVITSQIGGDSVAITFEITPNVCANKTICMMTFPESISDTGLVFAVDLTVQVYAVGAGKRRAVQLNYELLEQTDDFSVGLTIPYVSAPNGDVGIAQQDVTIVQMDTATPNTGPNIVASDDFAVESFLNLLYEPVVLESNMETNRSIRSFVLDELIMQGPNGRSWTILSGGKPSPLADTLNFKLISIDAVPLGKGTNVVAKFSIVPNVGNDPSTSMITPEESVGSINVPFDAQVKTQATSSTNGTPDLEFQNVDQTKPFAVQPKPVTTSQSTSSSTRSTESTSSTSASMVSKKCDLYFNLSRRQASRLLAAANPQPQRPTSRRLYVLGLAISFNRFLTPHSHQVNQPPAVPSLLHLYVVGMFSARV